MISRWKTTKLGLLLVGYFALASVIGAFSFGFLYTTSWSVAYRLMEKFEIVQNEVSLQTEFYWLGSACLIGAVVVFIAVLLFLLQQKFSYILAISSTVKRLEGGDLSARVELIGDDELTDLAESMNAMASTLEKQIALEEQLNREKGQIVASLSHDIRTPLTSIISYIDLIKEAKEISPEKSQQYLDIIHGKAYQIKDITDELFEQSARRERVSERERINMVLLLQQLMDEKVDELEEAGFYVKVAMELQPVEMDIEIMDFVRIFENICSNILKYGDKSNVVAFSFTEKDRKLCCLQRNGINKQHRIVESHGIGLKSCQMIVQSYGGTMKTAQEDGQFQIEIVIPY